MKTNRCKSCGCFIGKTHDCAKINKKQSESKLNSWKDSEYKKHMSEAHRGQHSSPETEFKAGSNPYWKGGIKKIYPKEFSVIRKERLKRSPNCFFCKTNNSLVVHHLDGNENHNKLFNLMTLCNPCHVSMHREEFR